MGLFSKDCGCGERAHGAQADVRYDDSRMVRQRGNPVLGATLGGGLSGSYIGSGVGRVGGGLTPPVLWAQGTDLAFPQVVQIFHADWSTPRRVFERRATAVAPINRELGGLLGGQIY